MLRSPHAHARIAALDVSAAAAMPGVVRVLTGAEAACSRARSARSSPRPPRVPEHRLAVDRVRHVGEPVAAVVAVDRARPRTRSRRSGRLRAASGRRRPGSRHARGRPAALSRAWDQRGLPRDAHQRRRGRRVRARGPGAAGALHPPSLRWHPARDLRGHGGVRARRTDAVEFWTRPAPRAPHLDPGRVAGVPQSRTACIAGYRRGLWDQAPAGGGRGRRPGARDRATRSSGSRIGART